MIKELLIVGLFLTLVSGILILLTILDILPNKEIVLGISWVPLLAGLFLIQMGALKNCGNAYK